MAEVTYQDINQVLTDIVNRIRSLESKYNLLGERLLIVNQNVGDLTKEMQFFATKEDFKVLEKYINLWDPMKLVSQKELENALEKVKNERRRTRK